MTKHKITIGNKVFEFIDRQQAEVFAENNSISFNMISDITELAIPIDMVNLIDARIQQYQSIAPKLTRDLYVANTLAGITTPQSDQMFDDFADVLTRIKEGAFPTALYRLEQKQPIGFVTQELIDSWKAKILLYIG